MKKFYQYSAFGVGLGTLTFEYNYNTRNNNKDKGDNVESVSGDVHFPLRGSYH